MPSRCLEDFLKRRVENDIKKAAAKAAGGAWSPLRAFNPRPSTPTLAHPLSLCVALTCKADTKRKPVGPRDGFVLPNVTAQTVTPLPYDILREGVKY